MHTCYFYALIIGGFRYQKREALLTSHLQYPGTDYGWQILLKPFYSISLSLFKEISHPSGLDSSCKQRFFCIFAPPYSMTCIRLWFLNFPKWQTHVNNLSILYRLPLVGLKSAHKCAGITWSKNYLKFMFFSLLYPLLGIFEIYIFRNVDHVKANRMPFEC